MTLSLGLSLGSGVEEVALGGLFPLLAPVGGLFPLLAPVGGLASDALDLLPPEAVAGGVGVGDDAAGVAAVELPAPDAAAIAAPSLTPNLLTTGSEIVRTTNNNSEIKTLAKFFTGILLLNKG